MHDHLVGRRAERAREAAVALERRRRTLRADVALGRRVEVVRRDARADLALHQPQRADEDRAGRGHRVDLRGSLLDDHAGAWASSPRAAASRSSRGCGRGPRSGGRVPSKRRSTPLLLVVVRRAGRSGRGRPRGACATTSGLSSSRWMRSEPSTSHLPSYLRRVEVDVVDAAGGGDAPAGDAAHDLLVGHLEQERGGERAPELGERLVERLGLGDRAREAVQDEAVGGLGALDLLEDHADDHLVGDELAAVHVALGLLAQVGARLHRLRAACRPSR